MQTSKFLAVALAASLLSGCADENVDDLCATALSTNYFPDLTGSAGFAIEGATPTDRVPVSSVAPGSVLYISVQVDGDTESVFIDLAPVGSTVGVGAMVGQNAYDRYQDHSPETIEVAYTVPAVLPAGQYYPVIALCGDSVENVAIAPGYCHPSGGFVEDTSNIIAQDNYARVIFASDSQTFIDPAVDATSAQNSCVLITSITVSP